VKELLKKQVCVDCSAKYDATQIVFDSESRDITGGRCHACRTVIRERYQNAYNEAQRQNTARTRLKWRQTCGIPPRFLNEEFGTFDTSRKGNIKKIYDICLRYAKGFPIDYRAYTRAEGKPYPSLYIYSEAVWGVGKSHLACSILHYILNNWEGETQVRPVHFISEPELYRKIQATYNYNNDEKKYRESEDDIINELIARPLLVIDDIGKERRQDQRFVQRVLFAIIDGRYKSLRPVVITSNLSPDNLGRYLSGQNEDDAIMDRLIEMTCKKFYQIKGESYRQ